MAGGTRNQAAAEEEEVDPASRRLVFWLEMENNMLRERVEESTVVVEALIRLLEHLARNPTAEHLEWGREAAPAGFADPRLEKLLAEIETAKPAKLDRMDTARSNRSNPDSPRGYIARGKVLVRSPTEPTDPASPRSFSERTQERQAQEKLARERKEAQLAVKERQRLEAEELARETDAAELAAAEERIREQNKEKGRRGSKQKVVPTARQIEHFPKIRILEARGLPKQLASKTLTVGNYDIDDVVEVEASVDKDGTAMCRIGAPVRIQDRGDGDTESYVAKISIRLGTQVVCRTEGINPADLPLRGEKHFIIPLFGKQKGKDGVVATVQQGELHATRD